MNKKLIVPGALIGMAALIFVAIIVDCVRLANDARHRVELADQELLKHEQRLVTVLKGAPERSSEVQAAIERHESASEILARHEAYQQLVTAFQSTMADKLDATNPLSRKFMDDAAGAINRRQVAEKAYDEELRAYKEFMNSWRGQLGGAFSDADSLAE